MADNTVKLDSKEKAGKALAIMEILGPCEGSDAYDILELVAKLAFPGRTTRLRVGD